MTETPPLAVRSQPRLPLAPAVARRMLCFELGQLIQTAGVTHQAVGEWLGVSRPAVTAALQGKTLLSRPAVEVICKRLRLEEWLPHLDGLLSTARRKPGTLKPATGTADLLLGLEAFADEMTIFDPWLVPKLLQTQIYAAALSRLDDTTHNLARETRQAALLTDHQPLQLRWITSEHALHRQVGSNAITDNQRAFLVEMTERANISILVISGTTTLPPVTPFCLVHGTSSVVVETSRLAVHYATDPITVDHFTRLADNLTIRALNSDDSARLIREVGG